MAIEKVRPHLERFGAADRIIEFDVSSATVEAAANAIGCAPEYIAKSLSFRVGDSAILVVAAGDARIDNPKYKAQFGTKARMLSADEVESEIGHAVGGVCPFGINDGVRVYLDKSLKRFDHVYPACGSSNSAVKLTVDELEQMSGCTEWVDVCRGWQDEN